MALLNTIKIKVATQTNHTRLCEIYYSAWPSFTQCNMLWSCLRFIILQKQPWKQEDRVIYNEAEGLSSWVIEKSMDILHRNQLQSKERLSLIGQGIGSEISELNSQ